MSVAEQLAGEHSIVYIGGAVAILAGILLLWLCRRPNRRSSADRIDYVRPVSDYLRDERSSYIDYYMERAMAHVPCEAASCSHKRWPGRHCRTCDLPYPCPLSGPLNVPRQRDTEPYNRQDDPGRGWW